jgi:translation initiation factor IF-2
VDRFRFCKSPNRKGQPIRPQIREQHRQKLRRPLPQVSSFADSLSPKRRKRSNPKKEQAQKPLATLEEWQQQQQQQRVQPPIQPPSPAAPTALKAPEKTQPTVKLPLDLGKVKITTDEEEEEGRPIGKRRPGQVIGREERRQRRREEARLRAATTKAETLAEQDQETEIARPIIRRPRPEAKPPAPRPVTQPRKGKVPIEPPITVRSLSEALGVSAQELIRKLVQRGQMLNINATLTPELAEELAWSITSNWKSKSQPIPKKKFSSSCRHRIGQKTWFHVHLSLRSWGMWTTERPVCWIGSARAMSPAPKRRNYPASSRLAGGTRWQTHHLPGYAGPRSVYGNACTRCPGHRYRVLVVAADDGVMPQTEEAISHARAANVPIIVAINKVDLPNANVQRTRNQLYSLGLIPDTMGGDTPFVETVAAKERPRGIQELLDMILLVAELRELKANPKKPAMGTCLEAKVTEGQGVVATLLVQNGTLHVGDVIVCGCSYGRVRAMFDANGKPLQEAGPATPVAVTGLDDIPEADDKFFVVPDLATAREIAERRRERRRLAAPVRTATLRLEDLDKTKLQELKLILKADVRGSIEAIKKELEKLQSDEIRLNVIHAGVGAITEGDVQLALASPEDTLIVGFNVVPDHRAQTLAEQRQVPIRLYNIIYQLTDDLKAALEGRLKPREEIVPLGRAVVREVFKISKVGTIAGCYVTQGVVERGAMVRVIREGRIIYPPPDRTATIESLRRFKEDVREVREGFECGIKISNFDDVKVDDVLEVYRIVQVQRTLDGTTARATS